MATKVKRPRKRLPAMSPKRSVESRVYAKRKKVFLRESLCARCKNIIPEEKRDLHHWAKRAGRLFLEETLWLMMCRDCHDWIHRHERQAQKEGWLAPTAAINNHARALMAWGKTWGEDFQ